MLTLAAWGLADGGNVISPDSEMIFYGILDLLAKPVFCFYHLWQLSKLDLSRLQLQSGKYSAYADGVESYDREKHSSRHRRGLSDVSTVPPPTVVENPPRDGVSYSPKKGTFSRNTRKTRDNTHGRSSGDVVATTGTNNVMSTNVIHPPRESDSTAVSHNTSSS